MVLFRIPMTNISTLLVQSIFTLSACQKGEVDFDATVDRHNDMFSGLMLIRKINMFMINAFEEYLSIT